METWDIAIKNIEHSNDHLQGAIVDIKASIKGGLSRDSFYCKALETRKMIVNIRAYLAEIETILIMEENR